MKYHIRKIKTASNGIAVQVIKYEKRKRVVVKHIGTSHNKDEVIILSNNAAKWIDEQIKQISLFPKNRVSYLLINANILDLITHFYTKHYTSFKQDWVTLVLITNYLTIWLLSAL